MLTKLIFNISLLYFYNNKNKLVIHKNSCHFCWRESRLLTHIICLLPSTSLSNNWHQGWHGVDGVFCGLHAPGCGVDHPEPPSAVTRGDPGGVVRAVSASAPVHPSLPLPPSQLQVSPPSHLLLVTLMNEARQREGLKKTPVFPSPNIWGWGEGRLYEQIWYLRWKGGNPDRPVFRYNPRGKKPLNESKSRIISIWS